MMSNRKRDDFDDIGGGEFEDFEYSDPFYEISETNHICLVLGVLTLMLVALLMIRFGNFFS